MTQEELKEAFYRHEDEFLKFASIENPRHRRPDLCAFLMLDSAVEKRNGIGGFSDMVAAAEHDQIWLEISAEDLAPVATDDLIRDLCRCGVMYDADTESLAMFA